MIPLDPENINIDFDKARLPLSDEVLAEGEKWYREFDVEEKEALEGAHSDPYVELIKEDLRAKEGENWQLRYFKSIRALAYRILASLHEEHTGEGRARKRAA